MCETFALGRERRGWAGGGGGGQAERRVQDRVEGGREGGGRG